MTAAAAAAQDSPCVGQVAHTLAPDAPGLVSRDSSRASDVQGGGLILTETVRMGADATLTVVNRSCLSYAVEYRLTLDPRPELGDDWVSLLAEALADLEPHNRSPVPLAGIVTLVRERGGELLDGEPVAIGDNAFGETIRIEYEPGAAEIGLVYVVGL